MQCCMIVEGGTAGGVRLDGGAVNGKDININNKTPYKISAASVISRGWAA